MTCQLSPMSCTNTSSQWLRMSQHLPSIRRMWSKCWLLRWRRRIAAVAGNQVSAWFNAHLSRDVLGGCGIICHALTCARSLVASGFVRLVQQRRRVLMRNWSIRKWFYGWASMTVLDIVPSAPIMEMPSSATGGMIWLSLQSGITTNTSFLPIACLQISTELCPLSLHTPWNGTGQSTYLEVLTGTSKWTCSWKCWTEHTRRAVRPLAVSLLSLLWSDTAACCLCVTTSTASSMNINAPAGDTASLWGMKRLQSWRLMLSSTTSQRKFPGAASMALKVWGLSQSQHQLTWQSWGAVSCSSGLICS